MGILTSDRRTCSVALVAVLVCALAFGSSQAVAGQTVTAKKRSAAAKKLERQQSLLKRQLRKNPGLIGSKRFMKAAVRFKLALPGELRIPQCGARMLAGAWKPVGSCLLLSLDGGYASWGPFAAWGRVPMTVTFLGGRPYEIALTIAPAALTTDNSLRTWLLQDSTITDNPVGVPGVQDFSSNGCSDILTSPGYLASDAYVAGGATAYPPPGNDAEFSLAYRMSVLDGAAKINPFRRSVEGKLDLRIQTVGVFRELDNTEPFHCLNIVTGSISSDVSLNFAREPALTHDFVPAADGSFRLAKIELEYGPITRPEIPACLTPVAPADVNLSVLGLGDFSGIPEVAWSTPCNAPPSSMGGTNPLYGSFEPQAANASYVELRPDMTIESLTAEVVLLPGGYVPKTG